MTKETSLPAKQRIWELDALRGLCILCMVAIHAFWDLSAFGGFAFDLPGWFLFCRQYGHILFNLLSGLCATLASRSFQSMGAISGRPKGPYTVKNRNPIVCIP